MAVTVIEATSSNSDAWNLVFGASNWYDSIARVELYDFLPR